MRKRGFRRFSGIYRTALPRQVLPDPVTTPVSVLLGETLDRWLKHKSANRKARTRTIANYEWLLSTYVKPALGSKAIAEVSESDVQELYNDLLRRGIGAKTVRNLHKVLEPAFTRAIGWKLLSENPCKHVELPVWDRKEARYLTPEQTQAFLAAARQDKWYIAFLIAVETGARPNEYLALRWNDVNFDERSVRICRSLYWPPGGGFEFTKPKTQRSVRTKTISRQAIEALRQHRRVQLEQRMQTRDYQDCDLIFATEIGTPLSWRNLGRRHLKPLLTASGIPEDGFSMYSLRHTHASLRIINGDSLRVVAEDMGTSVAMIDITYSHVPRSLQTSAAERLAGLLYGT